MIESLIEEGVGNTLNPVTSGCGEAVAVACAAEDSPVEEQAVRMINTITRMLDIFFIGSLGNQSNSNTYKQPLPFP